VRGLFVVLALLALIAPGGPAAAAESTGRLRVAHLSPDTPAVDVSVVRAGTEQPVAADLGYGEVGEYRELSAGRYAVAVRAAGSSPDTPPVLSAFVDVPADGARTVTVTGRFADLALDVLTDDLGAPPTGSVRVRVLDGTGIGGMTVTMDGVDLPATVPGGPGDVEIRADGASPLRLPTELPAGSVVTLVVLENHGALTVRPVIDAVAPRVVPRGPVPAGGGPAAPLGVLLGLLVGVGLLALRRSSRGATLVVAMGLALLPAPAARAAVPAVGLSVRKAPAAAVVEGDSRYRKSAEPVRVHIPAVGIDGPLTAVGLDPAGTLTPPQDVGTAGWFTDGPAPGEPGPALLAGHVNGGGRDGLFGHLDDVAPGDEVLIVSADGVTRRFTVTAIDRYAKAAFPTEAVYAATPDPELRLITCGGAFDPVRRSYTDNVVVSARLG
jgi:sortase (surface protein transpeptidase)